MVRKGTTVTAWLLLTSLLFATASGFAKQADAPNIIIMIADDLGDGDLGCYGHPTIRTPRIDALARDGLTFGNAFLTTSSCSPSRCSILTGLYPHNTGAGELHLPLPDDRTTVAKLLKSSGYHTAAAGKWHLGPAPRDDFDKIYQRGGPSGCEEWVKAVRDTPGDRPFFLWLAASDPHRGYAEGALEPPHSASEVVLPPYMPDTGEIRRDMALYYDEVGRFDRFVGEVVDELTKTSTLKQTVIFILSDNGRPFPRCKTTLYDSGIKTPLVVHHPGSVPPGVRTQALVSAVDIAPTVMELAGIPVPGDMQGVSFVPVLRDADASVRDAAFAEHNWHDFRARERSARTSRFLYIRNDLPELPLTPPADALNSPTWASMRRLLHAGNLNSHQTGCFLTPRPAEELYDVQMDPHQLQNLAGLEAYRKPLQQMRGLLKTWVEKTGDSMPDRDAITPDGFDRVSGKKLIQGAHPSF